MIPTMQKWLSDGRRFAIATVIKTWRSSPRQAGAAMLVSDKMEIYGSVSGGCVEGAVAKSAVALIGTDQSAVLRFGVSNEEAWQVGLSCGGGIDVHVRPFDIARQDDLALWTQILEARERDLDISWIFALDHSLDVGWIGDGDRYLPNAWSGSLKEQLIAAHQSKVSTVVQAASASYFLQSMAVQERLIVVGAAHISLPLAQMASLLDFRLTIIDPRGLFTDSLQQYCKVEDIHRAWPADVLPRLKIDDATYAVMLTHDPKIDDQALAILLRSDAKYIGALGSKKTNAKRKARLVEAGFVDKEIERIQAPIGLDIGALTPEEIALSVCSEIIKVRRQSTTS